MTRYLDDGCYPIDNNAIETGIRPCNDPEISCSGVTLEKEHRCAR
ncbi:MAG: hypothetical protein J0M09_16005 [Xanthomonadales bacterium]|nr:hypothetical protein [Xanthomonadales bacterium]